MIRRTFLRLAAAAALSLPLAACGGDATGPAGRIAGTWSLETVNGRALPVVIDQQGADRLELTSDRLTFDDGPTFSRRIGFRIVENGQTRTGTETDGGRYALDGSTVSITLDSDASTTTGTLSGSTLTIGEDGESFVYRRE